MVLMWLEAWAGSLGMARRAPTRGGTNGFGGEAIVRVPAWRRRSSSRPATNFASIAPGSSTPAVTRKLERPRTIAPTPRPFWIRVDRRVQGHAAIGGSFAEVCAALERLAAMEESRA